MATGNPPRLAARIEGLFDKDVFFICGVARSGTTWLQLLLDAHPEVACRGEAHFFSSFYDKLVQAFEEHNAYLQTVGVAPGGADFDPEDLDAAFLAAVYAAIGRWAGEKGVSCVGEKTPANLAYLARLHRLFPDAKVIHIIRDGRDCTLSGWHANIRFSKGRTLAQYGDFAGYVAHMARRWAEQMRDARAFAHREIGARYHELRYEDLLGEPERTLGGVLDFLEVERSEAVVAACLAAGRFENLSRGRPRGQEDPGSFYRKGVPRDWVGHFSDADVEVFRAAAGDLLRELGYD